MDRLVDFLLNFYGPTPYAIIFTILLGCGLGLPIPEDVVLIAAGLLAYYGVSQIGLMVGVCLVGVLAGDCLIFFLGSHYGRKLTKRWIFRKLLPEDRLQAVQSQFHRKGYKLLFFARFMPGLRAPVYFSAGTLHVSFGRFIIYDTSAAMISVPLIVGLIYWKGDRLNDIVEYIKRAEHGLLLVIFLGILAIIAKWYLTHRKLKRA